MGLVNLVVIQSTTGRPPLQLKLNCQSARAQLRPFCDNAQAADRRLFFTPTLLGNRPVENYLDRSYPILIR